MTTDADPTPPAPDTEGGGAEGDPDESGRTGRLVCELCGGPVLDRHCKVVCLNCGFQRDCSDP